jgi:hypothetical protein
MKKTPLERLVAHARKNPQFFQLLLTKPNEGLKEAQKQGIKLTRAEQAFVRKLVTGKPIDIGLEHVTAALRETRSFSITFWDILCKLLGKKGYK